MCKTDEEKAIDDCIGDIVPTDEELALLAGVSQEAIDKIKEGMRQQANEWRGLDHEFYF